MKRMFDQFSSDSCLYIIEIGDRWWVRYFIIFLVFKNEKNVRFQNEKNE
jgi:hypothetical protein